MRAVIYNDYGAPEDVLQLREIDKPGIGDDELLVRVRAASLNPYDWHLLRGLPYVARLMFGLRKLRRTPAVLGSDMAGQVEAVGRNVTRFSPGDEVFAEVGTGACSEYTSEGGSHRLSVSDRRSQSNRRWPTTIWEWSRLRARTSSPMKGTQ